MRTFRAFAVVVVLAVGTGARAEEVNMLEHAPHGLVDINPASLLWGELSLEFEHTLGPAMSILIGPQILIFNSPLLNTSTAGIKVNAYGATLAVHFFPWAEALHGFWIGPELDAAWATGTLNNVTASGAAISVNGILGYTFTPAEHFALSLGIGAGAHVTGVQSSDSTVVVSKQGFNLTGRAAIGYAW